MTEPYTPLHPDAGLPGRARQSPGAVAGRVVAGLVGAVAAVLWVLMAFVVLGSRFGSDPASDPHGFGIIFGTLLAAPVGLLGAATLPFAFPRPGRAFTVVVALFALGTVALFVALFTAP